MSNSKNTNQSEAHQQVNLTEAFTELEQLVQEFETGDIDLEKGIPKFKKGLALASMLKKRLQEIENEIQEIKVEFQETS